LLAILILGNTLLPIWWSCFSSCCNGCLFQNTVGLCVYKYIFFKLWDMNEFSEISEDCQEHSDKSINWRRSLLRNQ
jgi:hypothetical protein